MPTRRSPARDQWAEPFRRSLQRARRVLTAWGEHNVADYPWRSEKNQFHALIAEVLLQRTRAEQVIPSFQEFKKRFPAARDLGRATESSIRTIIKPLGLPWRAKFLKRLGQELADQNKIPSEPGELEGLPGIGPYAANAYVSFHGGRRGVLLRFEYRRNSTGGFLVSRPVLGFGEVDSSRRLQSLLRQQPTLGDTTTHSWTSRARFVEEPTLRGVPALNALLLRSRCLADLSSHGTTSGTLS